MKEQTKENKAQPGRAKLFWKIQLECLRRMLTPAIMYLFMSIIMLATWAINILWLRVLLGVLCLLAGMAFNAHLCYHDGALHYDAYMTGCLHRRNALFGIESGGDHRAEREYRPWKGFYIGFLIGIPVIVLGTVAGTTNAMSDGTAALLLVMLAGWAIMPIGWIRELFLPEGAVVNFAWSLLMIIVPVIVSGVFYIVGAMAEKRKKEAQAARSEAVQKLQEEQKAQRVQTEEQRRKTMQSKKKK